MLFLTLFKFLTRLLKSTQLKLFKTYLLDRNGTRGKTWFSAPKNSTKANQLKLKNQLRNRHFIDSYVFEYEGLYLSLRGEHIKDKRLH